MVLQGAMIRYLAIEKAAFVVVFITQRLRHYFHSFTVIVIIDLPIRKVLKKSDIAGRMVRWAVELSDFDIHYELRGPIKGHIYANFLIELAPKDPNSIPMTTYGSSPLMVRQTCGKWDWRHSGRTKRCSHRAINLVCVQSK